MAAPAARARCFFTRNAEALLRCARRWRSRAPPLMFLFAAPYVVAAAMAAAPMSRHAVMINICAQQRRVLLRHTQTPMQRGFTEILLRWSAHDMFDVDHGDMSTTALTRFQMSRKQRQSTRTRTRVHAFHTLRSDDYPRQQSERRYLPGGAMQPAACWRHIRDAILHNAKTPR